MIRWLRNHPLAWSVDHIHPRSAGGNRSNKNILLAHRLCNSERKNAIVNEGIPVKKFRQKVFSRLDVVDRRKERFRAAVQPKVGTTLPNLGDPSNGEATR